MKLGIILPPEAASLERAKSLGLDFVEFDCNPLGYGCLLYTSDAADD